MLIKSSFPSSSNKDVRAAHCACIAEFGDRTSVGLRTRSDQTYNIEYSEDLVNWAVVQADLSGDIQYEDTDIARLGKGVGYYRGVEK